MKAVAFDFGQTLGALDHEFMAKRLLERGATLDVAGAAGSTEQAWEVYGARKADGHARAWRAMIAAPARGRTPP